jgi:hypothetical protein
VRSRDRGEGLCAVNVDHGGGGVWSSLSVAGTKQDMCTMVRAPIGLRAVNYYIQNNTSKMQIPCPIKCTLNHLTISQSFQKHACQCQIKPLQPLQTATPLLFHPPGPLHAYTHSPIATHTLIVMAQKVGA